MLPHQFPFRLVERRANAGVWVVVTSNMWILHGSDRLPFAVALEMLAQGALELLQQEPGPLSAGATEAAQPARGLLAGIDEGAEHEPIMAGDRLRIEVELLGRFGPLIKIAGRIVDDNGPKVTANLLLAAT